MSYWNWDSLDEDTKKRHKKEFKIWINAINYGIRMVNQKQWTELERRKYILKKAEEIRLPYKDREELKQEIEMVKSKG